MRVTSPRMSVMRRHSATVMRPTQAQRDGDASHEPMSRRAPRRHSTARPCVMRPKHGRKGVVCSHEMLRWCHWDLEGT
jgi:hypothetical protein